MKFQNLILYIITTAISSYAIPADINCRDNEGNIILCENTVNKYEDFGESFIDFDLFPSSGKKYKRDLYGVWLNNWLWNPWDWWYRSLNLSESTMQNQINEPSEKPISRKIVQATKAIPTKSTSKTISINKTVLVKKIDSTVGIVSIRKTEIQQFRYIKTKTLPSTSTNNSSKTLLSSRKTETILPSKDFKFTSSNTSNSKLKTLPNNKVTTIRKRITKLTKRQIPVLSFNDAADTDSLYKKSEIPDDKQCILNEDK